MIDEVVDKKILEKTAKHFKKKGITLPTFAQLKNPEQIPQRIKDKLKNIGLWDLDPLNLFRITWKNEPKEKGGLFNGVNYLEFPPLLTGVKVRIIALVGKYFPTGCHKVGAVFGCLVPKIITGQFDPTYNKVVWLSTGNYCRGGAFDSYLMGCSAVAILPEEMSKERFSWLKDIGAEVIATPGCESNVKEIYDKCWEIRRIRKDCIIFNQFDEFGNPAWHYAITGAAIEEVFNKEKNNKCNLAAYVSASGSAGTLAAGDYLRTKFPLIKVAAAEALQCPTLLYNGFGGHRIEGIGDKHVLWVHNVKNTDMVTAIDDEDCMRLFRLFNEAKGKQYLSSIGLDKDFVKKLELLGISSIANLLASVKIAKYNELIPEDIIFTVATDSAEMYDSRIFELREKRGEYSELQAAKDLERCLYGTGIDHMKELSYTDRRAIHNLKYFTWMEQQEKETEDLDQLWYDREIWPKVFNQPKKWDELISQFNHTACGVA
ncbi:pyridoxal-phosphate dependent enzyme [Acidobacteriota bacterium]